MDVVFWLFFGRIFELGWVGLGFVLVWFGKGLELVFMKYYFLRFREWVKFIFRGGKKINVEFFLLGLDIDRCGCLVIWIGLGLGWGERNLGCKFKEVFIFRVVLV